jgi:hypothetical protein
LLQSLLPFVAVVSTFFSIIAAFCSSCFYLLLQSLLPLVGVISTFCCNLVCLLSTFCCNICCLSQLTLLFVNMAFALLTIIFWKSTHFIAPRHFLLTATAFPAYC